MSMINKEINDFSVQAYQNGEFKTITKNDIMKEWSLFFFYPADFTFVCPTDCLLYTSMDRMSSSRSDNSFFVMDCHAPDDLGT